MGNLENFFISAVKKHAPLANITLKGNNLPYIATDIRMMIRQRDYLRGKANKTGSDILRQAFHQIRIKVTYAIRKSRSEYFEKKLAESNGDLKKTWQTLKQAMNREGKSNPIDKLNVNGNEINDKMKIAEYCNKYFTDIGKKLASEIPPSNSNVTEYIKTITHAKFKFKQITPIQVDKIISKLTNGKATGIHQMPNKLLKVSKD